MNKRMRVNWVLVLACVALGLVGMLGLVGCGGEGEVGSSESDGSEKMVVYVTFYPGEFFVDRVGGELVEVMNPVPSDADPIFWRPGSDVLSGYQGAGLIVVNGAGFEKWVETVSLPGSRVVSFAGPYEEEWLRYEEAVTHSHGPEGDHSHEGLDGHTWVDPVNAKVAAGVIRDRLIAEYPDEAGGLQDRFAGLSAELDGLDAGLQEVTGLLGDGVLLASHPAYNYLAKRYGWEVVNLDLDPEGVLSEEAYGEIAEAVARSGARVMLWEGEPLEGTAVRLREGLGVESVLFSPAEALGDDERAAGEDYVSIMRGNVERLRGVLEGEGVRERAGGGAS